MLLLHKGAKFVIKMAAKKRQLGSLVRPSEFLSKKDNANSKTGGTSERKTPSAVEFTLIPPSRYSSTSNAVKSKEPDIKFRPKPYDESRKVPKRVQKLHLTNTKGNVPCSRLGTGEEEHFGTAAKAGNSPSQLDRKQQLLGEVDDSIEDSSFVLLKEIRSCKKQSEILHQELATQLEQLSKDKSNQKVTQPSNLERLEEALMQVHKNQDSSLKFHEFLESRVQKQADTIERVMQKFLDHQSEANTTNDTLSRRLMRMQEEHRDIQSHLEKQLDAKERQCQSYKQSLQKVEKDLQDLEMTHRRDVSKFLKDIKEKDDIIAILQEAERDKDKKVKVFQLDKDKELNVLQEINAKEIESLRGALLKSQKELLLEKDASENFRKAGLKKDKEVEALIDEKEKEIKELLGRLSEKDNELKNFIHKNDEERQQLLKNAELLKLEMEREIEHLNRNIQRMNAEFEGILNDERQSAKDLKAQLDDEEIELKKSKAELKALHAYIAEKELESSSQSLKSNFKLLENENMQLKETCQSLESAVELLNVRLLSMNNIIKIQETELTRDGVHHVGEASAKMLSKWRDRVYALLVQLKSHEISENENMVKLQTKLNSFEKQAQEQNSKISILENQLAEKNADNEMKNHKLINLSKELSLLENKCQSQKDQERGLVKCIQGIKSSANIFSESISNSLQKIENGLTCFRTLECRVSFAYKRLSTIKDLFQRKETIWVSKLDNFASNETGAKFENDELSEFDKQSLLVEVKTLTEEREVLRSKLKTDADKMVSIERNLEGKYKETIKVKDSEIEQLTLDIDALRKENSNMKVVVDKLEMEGNELRDEIETLRFDSKRLETNYERELAQKLDSEKEVHREELTKMNCIVNDTRREHTKAIVSLQQLERQMRWQKENNEKQLKEHEEIANHEIAKLKQKAYDLEKERNILLATIKQENIKMPKSLPVGLQPFPVKDAKPIFENPTKQERKIKANSTEIGDDAVALDENKTVKLAAMLKELQSISASLLQEDNLSDENGVKENEESTSDEL